jgi:hypothetical protein
MKKFSTKIGCTNSISKMEFQRFSSLETGKVELAK